MDRHLSAAPGGGARRHPRNTWYVLATSDEVVRNLLGRRALDVAVVLYRTQAGRAVALEDRDAHRPYPLSLGRIDGDTVVSGYSGFVYDENGVCVRVPTQDQVPYGARVRAFPVHDDGSFVWVWLGDPTLARLRPPPRTPWLRDPQWVSIGDAWDTDADVMLLHENFADITHVAVVDPFIAPPVLHSAPPPLEVQVTETTVSFSRSYPPAAIASWHAQLLGLPETAEHAQLEHGAFVSPGLWVDRWDVAVDAQRPGDDGDPGASGAHRRPVGPGIYSFRFTHAVTPVSTGCTRHVWRVSRNFALDDAASEVLLPIFSAYYRRVQAILQTMQGVLDSDGPRQEVNVTADAAALQVQKIIRNWLADESGVPARRPPTVDGSSERAGRA